MITLYNVVSSDGFISYLNGSEDFIPDETWTETLGVYGEYDVLVFGRKTYEAIQQYEPEMVKALEDLHIEKIVITHDSNFVVKNGYQVITIPEDLIMKDKNILVTSGPILNNYMLEHDLVDKVIQKKLDIEIGEGVLPFNAKYKSEYEIQFL